MSRPAPMPFVVGQWVTGPRFFGRAAMIARLLAPATGSAWVVGGRRMGKTSLLKQAEHLVRASGGPCLPVYWDLQGAADGAGLADSLDEALDDAAEHLEVAGLIAGRDLAGIDRLERLVAGLVAGRAEALLLVDEAEELLTVALSSPETLPALGRLLAPRPCLRVLVASSVRLADGGLAAGLGPLLGPLGPPALLGPLADDEADALLAQARLPDGRPALDGAARAAIRAGCGGHPFLLQLVAKRALEGGDAVTAVEAAAADPVIRHLAAADLALLQPSERSLLASVARGRPPADDASDEASARLVGLGFLRAFEGRLELAAPLLRPFLAI